MGKGREEGRKGKGKIEYITRKEEKRTRGIREEERRKDKKERKE